MAREAGGLPYQGGNTSGVGAVYLDNGNTPSPLELQLEQLKASDVEYQRQQRAKAEQDKITQGLIADINPDTKGILESDVPFFQEKLKGLQSKTQEYLAMPNGVEKNKKFAELQFEKKQIETWAQGSVGDKLSLAVGAKALADDQDGKLDAETWQQKAARLRSTPLDQRTERGFVPQPKPLTFDQNMQVFLKDKKQSTSSTPYSKSGMIGMEKITEYTPDQLKVYANEVVSSPKSSQSAIDYYNSLPDVEKQVYANVAGVNGNPVAEAVKAYIQSQQGKSRDITGYKESTERREAIKDQYEQRQEARTADKEQQGYKYNIERLYAVMNNNPDVWGEVNPKISNTQMVGSVPMPSGEKTTYVLGGTSLGDAIVQVMTKDGLKPTKIPNKILGFKQLPNGEIRVMTTKAQVLQNMGQGDGTQAMTEDIIDQMSAGEKDPTKAREGYRKAMKELGLYSDNGVVKIQQPMQTQPKSTKMVTIKGKEYSEEAVAKKAKDSGMTVKEYIDAVNAMK